MPEQLVQTPVVVCDYRPRQAHVGEPEDETEFKPSKMGEPYNYPLPKSKEDPWMTLLKPLQEKDAVRCKAWREEVENLLIFAGLFSAVVTAFIVESYKTLQPDSGDQSVVLLSLILSRLEGGMAVNTSTSTTLSSFSPTHSNIRVNILWFISLVLSLATVLVGIVSLQWLREHQRPRPDLPPRLAYSLFHMRVESIERWYLPQIFTMLPLLLQCGLVLFLAGVIEFLWQLNRYTAIPVVIIIGFVLCFLGLTTTLPSLQAISLFLPRFPWNKAPRVQCAYMSPQSWAFHRFIAPVINVIMRLCSVDYDRERELSADKVLIDPDRPPYGYIPSATEILFRLAKMDNWLDHGIGWLYQRDLDFISLVPTLKNHPSAFCVPPMFDANRALSKAMAGASSKPDDEIIAEENCVQQMSDFAKNRNDRSSEWYFSYLQRLYVNRWYPPSNNPAVQRDKFLFISGCLNWQRIRILMPLLRRHKLELLLRQLEWAAMPNEKIEDFSVLSGVLIVLLCISDTPDRSDLAGLGLEKPLQGIVEKFFKNHDVFDLRNHSEYQMQQTLKGVPSFLKAIGKVLLCVSLDGVLHQDSILEYITSRLRSALDVDPPSTQPDFLFYTTVIYLTTFPDEMTNTDKLRILTATLLEYHARMERIPQLERYLSFDYNSQWLGALGFKNLADYYPPMTYSRGSMNTDSRLTLQFLISSGVENPEQVYQMHTWTTSSMLSPVTSECGSWHAPNPALDESQPTLSNPTTATADLNSHNFSGLDDSRTIQTLHPTHPAVDAAYPRNSLDNPGSQDWAVKRTSESRKTHIHIDIHELSDLGEPTAHNNPSTVRSNATTAIEAHSGNNSDGDMSQSNATQSALPTDDSEF